MQTRRITLPVARWCAILAAATALVSAGCADLATKTNVAAATPVPQRSPPDRFFANVADLCGHAFLGRVLVDTPATPTSPFEGKPLVMHVRECGEREIRIPFHVGDDRSRTWVLTRTASGMRLKHDHRHEDGSHDKVTMYGGDTADVGTAGRQAFPVDAESIANFQANGLAASINNTWAMEIEPGQRFVYELSRPNGRLFRVEFDLSMPVPAPLPPWGATP